MRKKILREMTAAEHSQTGRDYDPTQPLYIEEWRDEPDEPLPEHRIMTVTSLLEKKLMYVELVLKRTTEEKTKLKWENMTDKEREELLDTLIKLWR